MKNPTLFLALLALVPMATLAEDVDTNRHADTVVATLSPYSLGIGAGALAALNPELQKESEQFMKVSIIQSITMGDRWEAGMDLDWYFPGGNWGGALNLDFLLATGNFRPFLGVGAGMNRFATDKRNFGEEIGPSGSAHVGMLLDVLDELQVRVRVPFTWVANHDGDRIVGLDVGLLFSNPLRTKKVRKLNY